MIKKKGHGKSMDWYLLGVLLFDMLVGEAPYFSQTTQEWYHNISKGYLKVPKILSLSSRSLIIEVSFHLLLGYSY